MLGPERHWDPNARPNRLISLVVCRPLAVSAAIDHLVSTAKRMSLTLASGSCLVMCLMIERF
ncbi:hypothetical protein Mal15_00050 [Stieleria maiorica]|uniref:Uncharacterized protein n=1 Tax=Stieleria maiorica TaxID=2795974 RepID=A0A5B9M5B4_9BACT|nr:hypothetical protein Mal15_00050 [Stieleria maiorica]